MKVMIATDGNLDVEQTADLVSALASEPGASVDVVTVIEIPRTLLANLRAVYGEQPPPKVDADAEYVGTMPQGRTISSSWPGDDEMIGRYIEDQTGRRTSAIVAALASRGVAAEAAGREGEEAVPEIMTAALELEADVIVVGSSGAGAFDGLLGSVATKLARKAPCSVMIVR